jgi:hypothetical protein
MTFDWFNALPDSIREILIGAAGDFTGGLAGQAVSGLLSMASYLVRRRFQSEAQQQALQRAMAQALAETASAASDDEETQRHFLDMLAVWLEREAVLGELSQLVDPRPDASLDLKILAAEFEAAGFAPDWLGAEGRFAEIVAKLAGAFYTAAASQPALQGQIAIGLLRRMAEAAQEEATQSRQQSRQLAQIAAQLRDFHPLDLSEWERAYLRGLYADCTQVTLALQGPVDEVRPRQPRLQYIYVDLETTTPPDFERVFARLGTPQVERARLLARWRGVLRRQRSGMEGQIAAPDLAAYVDALDLSDEKKRGAAANELGMDPETLRQAVVPISALETFTLAPQFVLLGDPGIGKSTLTRRLAASLAVTALGNADLEEQRWSTQVQQSFQRWLLPVRVTLSTWARHLPADAAGCADDLIGEVLRILARTARLEGPRQRERLVARLTGDHPTALLLLDGLDEVADVNRRKTILAAVRDFCQHYPKVPLLISCRVRPYEEGKHYKLPLVSFRLAGLERPAMGDFVERWHRELKWAGLYSEEGARLAQDRLLRALDDPNRKELREMAATPLLLTMMARVNYDEGLPEGRARLYETYVQKLLYEWEREKLDDRGQPTRLELLLKEGGVSDASLDRALDELAYKVHGQGGERDTVDIPAFAVRQALEAIHPGAEDEKAAWAVRMLRLIDDRSGLIHALEEGSLYRFSHRTFQEYLAARWLASGEYLPKFRQKLDQEGWREAIFLALGYQINVLKGQYDSALAIFDEEIPPAPCTEADWRRVLLLGEAYTRLLGPQRAREAEQKQRAQRVIDAIPNRLTVAMQKRDLPPRQRLDAGLLLADLHILPPDLDEFVSIAASAELGYDFRMGKYPITNSQYRIFVDEDGYAEDKPWWTEEAVKDIEQYSWNKDWRKGPRLWGDPRFDRDTQPVVGVSWYEAVAYCKWLTEKLRSAGKISRDEIVRLPTEKEWHWVAAGAEGRTYAWGAEFAAWCVNSEESNLDQPTPVHMYPQGKTPNTEVWDLCGNVWEWTNDDHEAYGKAVRGGAYYRDAAGVQASARSVGSPLSRDDFNGFRCVVVPISRA